jgi:tRNA (guanine-N(7)-)-methyltransferase
MKKIEELKNYKNYILEIGAGNGHFLKELNNRFNDDNSTAVIGVEIVKKFYKIALQKNLNFTNSLLLHGDINNYIDYFEHNSFKEIHINFPDPWYKKKHNKRILCKPTFLNKLSMLLTDNGKISVITDVFDLCIKMISSAEKLNSIKNNFLPSGFKTNLSFTYTSFYNKAIKNNAYIFFIEYIKIGGQNGWNINS